MTDFWSKQLNVPVRETRDSQAKHLTIKALIVLAIKIKYASTLRYQSIFSEFEITNRKNIINIVDVYHENKKGKCIYCYEIQKVINEDYKKEKIKFYENYEQYGFKTIDWILVDTNYAPNNIDELWKWINKIVV